MTEIKSRRDIAGEMIRCPLVVCELVPHPEGAWTINNSKYRPTWPRAFPFPSQMSDEDRETATLEVITEGINVADLGTYSIGTPRIRIEVYGGGNMGVFVDGEERTIKYLS